MTVTILQLQQNGNQPGPSFFFWQGAEALNTFDSVS